MYTNYQHSNNIKRWYPSQKIPFPSLVTTTSTNDIVVLYVELWGDEFGTWRTVPNKPPIWNMILKNLPVEEQEKFENINLLAAFAHGTSIDKQMTILLPWLEKLEQGFKCYHPFLQKEVLVIPILAFFSSDMLFGNPVGGFLDVRHATYPCRQCLVDRENLSNPFLLCEHHEKTKQQMLTVYHRAENAATIAEGNYILQRHGLNKKKSPFLKLQSLQIPKGLPQCRLHVMDLGLFDRLLVLTYSYLNSNGEKLLEQILQSDVLPFPKSSRLRTWKIKSKQTVTSFSFNGDDVSKLLPYLTIIWNFVLIHQHMNGEFYNIFNKMAPGEILSLEHMLSTSLRTFESCK